MSLQYTYTIHVIILTPFGNWSSSLWKFYSWSVDIHDSNTSIRVIWISILISSFFSILFLLILSLEIAYSMLKLVAEIRARSGIVVSQRSDVEDCCVLSWTLIFTIPYLIWISRTKFLLRWVECNTPNLIILYFKIFTSIDFDLSIIFIYQVNFFLLWL